MPNVCREVIIPASKPYFTLQGEGGNRTVISWLDTAASARTLMSASMIVESFHGERHVVQGKRESLKLNG
jgi:hypothetical protein